jgi:hypothetical protein
MECSGREEGRTGIVVRRLCYRGEMRALVTFLLTTKLTLISVTGEVVVLAAGDEHRI